MALETASPAVMLSSVGEPEPTVALVRASAEDPDLFDGLEHKIFGRLARAAESMQPAKLMRFHPDKRKKSLLSCFGRFGFGY
jgi:hypothetical protein